MAAALVHRYSRSGELLYDPFSGCGTVAFEAWRARRRVVANDLSPYANLLTRAKLFPYRSLQGALQDFARLASQAAAEKERHDLRTVPAWVRAFFHPETLRDLLTWTGLLKRQESWFLLACLLGILHHQRPGFLSYPSSHTVPYLRTKKFPKSRNPKLYEYRSLKDRLEAKVIRAFRRVPDLDFRLSRRSLAEDAAQLSSIPCVDAIVTSPPYMRQLDYGRDNRLRLWFLGHADWHSLDKRVSPGEEDFLVLMRKCFQAWRTLLRPGGYCVLIVGDNCSREGRKNLPQDVAHIATSEVGGYKLVTERTDAIPNNRRVRREFVGSTAETILVLRNISGRK